MDSVKKMRTEVKKYIDTADEKVVKMVRAMLEVDADGGRWDALPDNTKAEVEEALKQADNGETMTHGQIKKKHPQWFTK